jgi:HEAT repeat protein
VTSPLAFEQNPISTVSVKRERFHALSKNSTLEAQGALLEVLEKEPNARKREYAAETLGASAQHLEGSDPERAEGIVTALLHKLASAQSEDEQLAILGGIGLSGSAAALDSLDALLQSASSLVRIQAVKSLRIIRDERADALIIRTLLSDSETAVRASAAFVTSFRKLETVITGLQQAAARDRDPLVRLTALDVLGPAARTKPEVIPALEWLAKNDLDARVRERAARFLQKLTS